MFLLPEVPAMSSPSPSSRSWKSERARVGALARCAKTGERSPDDPDLIEARRNLCALKLEEHMRLALATTPSSWLPSSYEDVSLVLDYLKNNPMRAKEIVNKDA